MRTNQVKDVNVSFFNVRVIQLMNQSLVIKSLRRDVGITTVETKAQVATANFAVVCCLCVLGCFILFKVFSALKFDAKYHIIF